MLNCDLVRNLMQTADNAASEKVAFLCLWMAYSHTVQQVAREQGLGPSYALRRNGTLRTQRVLGHKMPELVPIRTTRLLDKGSKVLSPDMKDALLQHPSISFFCQHIPYRNGKPLPRTRYGEPVHGVLDVAFTLDKRYPVWAPLDQNIVSEGLKAEDSLDKNTAVSAVLALLETIYRNLITSGNAEDMRSQDVLNHGIALLRFLLNAYDMCNR